MFRKIRIYVYILYYIIYFISYSKLIITPGPGAEGVRLSHP